MARNTRSTSATSSRSPSRPATTAAATSTPQVTSEASKELLRTQYDDLLRRMDHHAHTVRTTGIDFFKTMMLVNAGGFISCVSVTTSYHIRLLTLKEQIPSTTETIPPAQVTKPASEFMLLLAQNIRVIVFCLLCGLFCSVLGYLITYFRARDFLVKIREKLDNTLYAQAPMEAYRPRGELFWNLGYGAIIAAVLGSFGVAIYYSISTINAII